MAQKSKRNKRVAVKRTYKGARTIVGKDGKTYKRVKTGSWRPVPLYWMSRATFYAIRCLCQYPRDNMSREARRYCHGVTIFGKDRHKDRYGTGFLQKWADKMVREGKDPHILDLNKAPVALKRAFDYWNNGSFDELAKKAEEDGDLYDAMASQLERMCKHIPNLAKKSRRQVRKEIKEEYYRLQFGPNGCADPWDNENRCPIYPDLFD